MKIVFLFDQVDNDGKVVATETIPFVTTPDKLNLRNIAPGMSSLGVVFEQTNEAGEKSQVFRQIINFAVELKEKEQPAQPAVPQGTVSASPAPAAPETKVSKPVVKKAKKSGK